MFWFSLEVMSSIWGFKAYLQGSGSNWALGVLQHPEAQGHLQKATDARTPKETHRPSLGKTL